MSDLHFVSNYLRSMYPNAILWYNEAQGPVVDGSSPYGRQP